MNERREVIGGWRCPNPTCNYATSRVTRHSMYSLEQTVVGVCALADYFGYFFDDLILNVAGPQHFWNIDCKEEN